MQVCPRWPSPVWWCASSSTCISSACSFTTWYLNGYLYWTLVSVVLKPGDFLPTAVGVFATLTAGFAVKNKLFAALACVHLVVSSKLAEKVNQKLKNNSKTIAQKTGKKSGEEVTMYDAFQMYDTTGDGMIDYYEYRDLLIKLDLDLSEENKRLLFVEVDVNETGTLEFSEFEEIMQLLKEKQTEQAMIRMGFTQENLIMALIVFVVWLTLLIIFILVSISAFTGGTAFDGCVNAGMTASVGIAAQGSQKKKETDDKEIEDSIDAALDALAA